MKTATTIIALQFVAIGFVSAAQAASDNRSVRAVAPKPIDAAQLAQSDDSQFCENIKDTAREQRYALKTRELNELRAAIEKRIEVMEAKRAEFETWMKRRETFINMADDSLVEIYAKMRPDAAAGRLEILGETLAAAILLKLPARQAGVILNEMKAEKAAQITQVIALSGRRGKRS